jgi:hypothetical protein
MRLRTKFNLGVAREMQSRDAPGEPRRTSVTQFRKHSVSRRACPLTIAASFQIESRARAIENRGSPRFDPFRLEETKRWQWMRT